MRASPILRLVRPEISRFPCKERACMPGSPTTPGRPSACVDALGHVAFRYTDSVGTREQFSIAAVAVGTGITSRPPRRSRRAAFPHRAPLGSATWPTCRTKSHMSVRGREPRLSTCSGAGSGVRRDPLPLLPSGVLPSTPSAAGHPRLVRALRRYYYPVRLLTPSSTASPPRLPVTALNRSRRLWAE